MSPFQAHLTLSPAWLRVMFIAVEALFIIIGFSFGSRRFWTLLLSTLAWSWCSSLPFTLMPLLPYNLIFIGWWFVVDSWCRTSFRSCSCLLTVLLDGQRLRQFLFVRAAGNYFSPSSSWRGWPLAWWRMWHWWDMKWTNVEATSWKQTIASM